MKYVVTIVAGIAAVIVIGMMGTTIGLMVARNQRHVAQEQERLGIYTKVGQLPDYMYVYSIKHNKHTCLIVNKGGMGAVSMECFRETK